MPANIGAADANAVLLAGLLACKSSTFTPDAGGPVGAGGAAGGSTDASAMAGSGCRGSTAMTSWR